MEVCNIIPIREWNTSDATTPRHATPLTIKDADEPEPIGHTRTPDRGAIIDVKTWDGNPTQACHRCPVCNVVGLSVGLYQCMRIELPGPGQARVLAGG